jgi:hypothetical protein
MRPLLPPHCRFLVILNLVEWNSVFTLPDAFEIGPISRDELKEVFNMVVGSITLHSLSLWLIESLELDIRSFSTDF